MFDSLDDTMKHDEQERTTPKERALRLLAVALVSILLFGGLIFTVRMFE